LVRKFIAGEKITSPLQQGQWEFSEIYRDLPGANSTLQALQADILQLTPFTSASSIAT
jgi:hypothetical protein